jgi:hypothetical protein
MVHPAIKDRCVVLTTPQLVLDLREIDHLIAALRRAQPSNRDDLDDLNWLQTRRRYVLALLAARRAQRVQKIVSLERWRDGGVAMRHRADVA